MCCHLYLMASLNSNRCCKASQGTSPWLLEDQNGKTEGNWLFFYSLNSHSHKEKTVF